MGTPQRGFASDNAATVHPAVLARIAEVNVGHAFGYGHDPYSAAVAARVAEELSGRRGSAAGSGSGTETGAGVDDANGPEAFFTFNGSGANVLSLRACCRPWQAVICSEHAHIHTDESGAPEAVGGLKLLLAAAPEGKMTPASVERVIASGTGDEHSVVPRVLSITQSTELGTLYSLDELRELRAVAGRHGMLVHIDGARLANAAVALDCELADVVAGADIVSFGATKNGALGAECVVVLNPSLTDGMLWLRKQTLQLASKMRFLAAQFDALLSDGLWRMNAENANAMARRLEAAVRAVDGVQVVRSAQANAVFATLENRARDALLEQFDFYPWDETAGEVRWMCSWDTTEADVDAFSAAVAAAVRPAA